ncbi:MAG: dihydrolipoyl dehydrogenase [Lentisphaerae bacterium]|nr:dihydrolipoyl dehydrogenase [Lentisphaerota bacterium]
MEKYDVVVVGAGPGGYPAAIRAAQRGARVALIEKEQLGGTCLNWGCIPTKTLIATAGRYRESREGADFGLQAQKVAFHYDTMIRRKNTVVGQLRGGIGHLLKANGVTVIPGVGAFETRNRIVVTGAGNTAQRIEAAHVIVATGSVSATIPGLPVHARVVDSRAFLDLTKLPKRLIVLGGGVVGCEFACMAAQLDVRVTLVELLDDILLMLDPDVRSALRMFMEKKLKIKVLTGQPLTDVKADARHVAGKVNGEAVTADLLLVAVGRKPVTDGLCPEKAGLKLTSRGCLEIDDYCQTGAATVYAVGDVTGSLQLAHLATAQGLVAADNACGQRGRWRDLCVPSCIFTAPEIGIAGLSETEARAKKLAVKVGKFPLAALGKTVALGETTGFMKWICDAETEQVLGAQAVGLHATELIAEAVTAIQAELTAEEVARTIHAHPTVSEAWMEAAHAVRGHCIHAAPRKK